MEKILLAGAAREDITPAVGTCLYGYRPGWHSESVHDPLQVTAAAFSQNGDTAVLFSVTVGDFQTELSDEIRGKLGLKYGISPARIIIAATHTHSAPNVSGVEGWGEIDREYVDGILFPAMEKACGDALSSMVPAEIAVGECDSFVGINRREQRRDGSIDLGQNPWGCFDKTMTCIAIRNAETKAGILNMIHYGCHGTAAGCNREITRDWSGIMVDRLERETGTMTAYFNGAQGDVGPRLTNGRTVGDIRYVEELGGVAAADAMRAYRAAGGYHVPEMKIFEGDVNIPYKPLLSVEEVRAKLDSYENPEALINVQKMEYAHYRDMEAVLLEGRTDHPACFTYRQTLLVLDEVLIVPFPYEMFSEITLRLRAYAPYRYVLGLSNANGYEAYLPTEDQLVRGGYEVACFLYNGAFTLVNNADQIIIDENLKLLK